MHVIKALFALFVLSVFALPGVTTSSAGADVGQSDSKQILSKGESQISWSDGTIANLPNWSLGFAIMEGPDGKDSAEISLSSTSTALGDRLAFTIPVTGFTAETLFQSATFVIDHKKNLDDVMLEIWRGDDYYFAAKSEIEISNIDGGNVFGNFEITMAKQGNDEPSPMEVSGSFRGKVELVCNALSSDGGLKTGAVNNPDGSTESSASWVLVEADHPFCAQYM